MNRISALAIVLLIASAAFAQTSPQPVDAVIPVVGSTRGASNANFKTELQLTNAGTRLMSGWLYLRPQRIFRRYELPVHTTIAFEDVVADLGGSGLGSLDVLVDQGGLPTIVARAYDDQATGTTGVSVPAITPGMIIPPNETAALIAPRDLGGRYRFNIGVRALENGATLEVVVYSASGVQRHARIVEYPAHHFEQTGGDAFAGIALQSNDSIHIRFSGGSAIVYATTVDNATNDSSIQVLRR